MNAETIVSLISKGKPASAQEVVNDLLYAKSGEMLSQYKQKLGRKLFGQEEE